MQDMAFHIFKLLPGGKIGNTTLKHDDIPVTHTLRTTDQVKSKNSARLKILKFCLLICQGLEVNIAFHVCFLKML